MKKIIILMTSLLLSACDSDTATTQQALIPSEKPVLTAFMNRQNMCSIIGIQDIQKILELKSQVTEKVESYGGYYTCEYSWDGVKYGRFSISLSVYKPKLEVFPPIKLSEKEIINTIGDAATLVRTASGAVLTTVIENTKLTIMMENPLRSESIKLIAKHILTGK